LNGKIEEKYFTERINSNKREKILCEKPTVVTILAPPTLFSIQLFVFVRKRRMTYPGSKSSKVIALQNETVGGIEEQLPDDKQGVCYTVALPITLKNILRQKKNYENSNISSCQNI
jgi:hypothetical protein